MYPRRRLAARFIWAFDNKIVNLVQDSASKDWLSSLFMNTAWLSSQQNLEDFVRAFENATIPKSQWDHRAHIVVAAYYAEQYGLASTLEKLRTGISVLNSKHGIDNTATSGYHETITVFGRV